MKERIWTRDFALLMIGLLLVSCANYFFASSIAVYARLLSSSAAYAGLLTSSFYFGSVGMRLVNGILVQKYGARRLMLLGAALCTAACAAHGFAASVGVLLVFRVLHGAGYSVFSTASGTAASRLVPRERLSEGMGYYTIGNVLAMAVGPSIALSVVAGGTAGAFHSLFAAAAAICAAALLLVCLMKPESGQSRDEAPAEDTALPKTFLGFEKGVVYPAAISFLLSLSYSPVIVYLSAYGLQRGWRNVGFAFTMYALGLLASRLFAGRVSDRKGPDRVMYPAYLCGVTALTMIGLCPNESVLYAAMVVMGLCVGAYNPQINVFCISRCSSARRGTATAAFNGASDLGLAVGSSLAGVLIGRIGYSRTYLCGACVCAATTLLYTFTLSDFHAGRRTGNSGSAA